MKYNIIKFIKKQWLLIWLLVVSVGLISLTAYAMYPGTNNFMKRVVLWDESNSLMFTSNLLSTVDNDRVSYRPVYVRQLTNQDEALEYDVDVFVWNYDIDGSGNYYNTEIEYDLQISIVDAQGNTVTELDSGKMIRIFKNGSYLTSFSSGDSSFTYSTPDVETLATNQRSQNKYTIKFSKSWDLRNDANKRILIRAVPTSAFPDLKPLAAAIGLKPEQTDSTTGWKYYIAEQRISSTGVPSDYDAYNIVFTGTGEQSIEIEWDPTKLAFNKDFYEANGAFTFASGEVTYTQGGGSISGWDKLVIAADSYDSTKEYRNRYDIQLYKVAGEVSSAWNFAGDSVSTGIYLKVNIPEDSNDNM